MSDPTSGPWTWQEDKALGGVPIYNTESSLVAIVNDARGDHASTLTDARLIAAAPDFAVVARAAFRLLTPEQCARLTDEEEAAFGRVEAIVRAEDREERR